MLKKYLNFIFVFFIITSVFAQNNLKTDTLKVNVIGQKEGLLQLNVKAIAQDNLDYLWLATEDGLHRYNSSDFKIYLNNPLDSLSIPEDHVRDLYVTNDTLFVASNSKGVFGLKMSTDTFFEISEKESESSENTSYRILPLNNKQILFSLRNTIKIFNRNTKDIKTIELPENDVENYVKSLFKINETTYLLATSASGLQLLNVKDYSIKSYLFLDNSEHNALIKHKSLLYVGTGNGLYVLDVKSKQSTKIIKGESINCFYKKEDETLLLGADSGLLSYNTTTKELINQVLVDYNQVNYSPIAINDIAGDKKGNIWFGTDGEGFLHYNTYREKFKTLKLKIPGFQKSKKVSTFQLLPLQDSTLFIGSTSGIVKYDYRKSQFKQYTQFNEELIYTLIQDANGTIWAGGFTTGLLKLDKEQDRFIEVKHADNFILDRDVIQITPLSKNVLLIATWSGGLYKYHIEENRFENYLINNKQLNRARTSFIDSKQNIWLGTDEGVFKINPLGDVNQFTSQDPEDNKINSDRIFGIDEDSKGNIWIGTSVGLTKLDPLSLKTKRYFKQKGLPNDFVYSVLLDSNDHVWVSTNFGISVLNPQQDTFINYTHNDGLQNNEFNGKAGFKDRFNNLYFGGVDGINIFNPKQLVSSPFLPKVHIESVELFNTPLNNNELFKKRLDFKSHENVLTFNFSALNYLNPNKVDYAYFMEGFDNAWRPITKSKTTTYTNLNPGDYIFKVKATNASGNWSDIEDEMRLTIVPPWYKTMFFKVFSVIIVLLGGFVLYLYKTYRLRQEKLKLEKLVVERTKEVSEKNIALKEAFETSETQKENIKFLMREMQHRVKNNLQIISSLLNIQSHHLDNTEAIDSLRVAKNRILAISHVEDKMKSDSDIVEIKEFTIELCHGILNVLSGENQLKFKTQYQVESNQVKGLNTTVYGLVLNELLTNITKHAFADYSENNIVNIGCKIVDSNLILTVQDNGKGYKSTDVSPSSMGLDLIKDMVLQLNGTIEIHSENGTLNSIVIPI